MSACIEWPHGRDKNGYGRRWHKGQTRGAHRVAWELVNGPIPAGMFVCHTCDNPPCINVQHLFLGTALVNNRDKISKGRAPDREKHGRSRLSEQAIVAIRKAYAAGGISQKTLARQYGVAYQTIGRVVRQETWT